MIGAGIVGLSAAYALMEMDVPVRVYETAAPGKGQSAGESRIFRHAHDDPRLVEFARRSRAVWDDWAQRFGVELVSSDGAVAIGATIEDRLDVLERVGGVPARAIDSAGVVEACGPKQNIGAPNAAFKRAIAATSAVSVGVVVGNTIIVGVKPSRCRRSVT